MDFFEDFLFVSVLYSTLLHLPPPGSTVSEDAAGLNPGLLRLWHWQLDALTIQLDLIHSGQDLICCKLLHALFSG
jgi:hypothetical protein